MIFLTQIIITCWFVYDYYFTSLLLIARAIMIKIPFVGFASLERLKLFLHFSSAEKKYKNIIVCIICVLIFDFLYFLFHALILLSFLHRRSSHYYFICTLLNWRDVQDVLFEHLLFLELSFVFKKKN